MYNIYLRTLKHFSFLLLGIVLLRPILCFAQQNKIDSLSTLLETASVEEKVDLHNEIALYYRSISFEKVKEHSMLSYRYAKSVKNMRK